jgi:MFS superfamily sulfate permease-like transporter
MAIAKITRSGLIVIAILVAILWTCVLAEKRISRNSKIETYRALRDMRYLKFKRRVEPTSSPEAPTTPSAGPVLG